MQEKTIHLKEGDYTEKQLNDILYKMFVERSLEFDASKGSYEWLFKLNEGKVI